MKEEQFIEICRFIGRILGQPNERLLLSNRVACHFRYDQDAIFYSDDEIVIGVGTKDLSLLVEKLENNNPVVCINPDGTVLRWHGEAWDLEDKVDDILVTIF